MAIGTPQPIQSEPQQLNNSVQETVEEQPQVVDQAQEIMPEPAWDDLTTTQKIAKNPNNCDLTHQIIWESDGTCHDMPKQATVTKSESRATVGSGSCYAEILKYDWNHAVANAVMLAESGGNPGEVNNNPATRDYSVGCFQVNLYGSNARNRPSEATLKIASENVRWAYNHYVALGRTFGTSGGWGAFNNGSYLRHL